MEFDRLIIVLKILKIFKEKKTIDFLRNSRAFLMFSHCEFKTRFFLQNNKTQFEPIG